MVFLSLIMSILCGRFLFSSNSLVLSLAPLFLCIYVRNNYTSWTFCQVFGKVDKRLCDRIKSACSASLVASLREPTEKRVPDTQLCYTTKPKMPTVGCFVTLPTIRILFNILSKIKWATFSFVSVKTFILSVKWFQFHNKKHKLSLASMTQCWKLCAESFFIQRRKSHFI